MTLYVYTLNVGIITYIHAGFYLEFFLFGGGGGS